MKVALLLASSLVVASAFANDRHPNPSPPPERTPPRCSCWWQNAAPVVGTAALVGVVVWRGRDGHQQVAVSARAAQAPGRGPDAVSPVIALTLKLER